MNAAALAESAPASPPQNPLASTPRSSPPSAPPTSSAPTATSPAPSPSPTASPTPPEAPAAPTQQATEQATEDKQPQQPPEPAPQPPSEPGFLARGHIRRRARFLRAARELAYRDLGGLVFDLHRFEQRNDEVVAAKLATLGRIDTELRALEAALKRRMPLTVLREAGVSACPRCAAIHGSFDRFCPACGLAVRQNERPIAAAPAPVAAATPPVVQATPPAAPAPSIAPATPPAGEAPPTPPVPPAAPARQSPPAPSRPTSPASPRPTSPASPMSPARPASPASPAQAQPPSWQRPVQQPTQAFSVPTGADPEPQDGGITRVIEPGSKGEESSGLGRPPESKGGPER